MVPHVRREIRRSFESSIAVKRRFVEDHVDTLTQAIQTVAQAFAEGHKVLLFGNGGSASDAQHIAAEMVNRFKLQRPGLPAIALTTDSSTLTSIANDRGYASVFARQIDALGSAGDVALAISTSGNSPSVLRAVRWCRRKKIKVIALTGGSGGRLARVADIVLNVSASEDTARIQETHILIGHVLCEQVDALLFGAGRRKR